jgi:flagella basal body P-ring formation protein FlgA
MRALLAVLILFAQPLPAVALPLPVLPLPSATAAVPGILVTEAELRHVVSDYLMKKGANQNAEVSIKRIGISGDVKLPPGKVSYEVVAPDRWKGWGNASLALIVRVDDNVKRNLTVLVEVEALTEMVVATRTLERGEVVGDSDVALARRDLAQVQGKFCRSKGEVLGMRVKFAVTGNSPLRGDYLERLPIVKSGQLVTILVENEVVRITTSGRAKGDGALGDIITVQILPSQKELAARVADATTVRVDF